MVCFVWNMGLAGETVPRYIGSHRDLCACQKAAFLLAGRAWVLIIGEGLACRRQCVFGYESPMNIVIESTPALAGAGFDH
jgi:hypothetical protein